MYLHPEHNSNNNVQLLAPDYDPNIDQDNQLILTTSIHNQEAESNVIDAKNSGQNNNQTPTSPQHPNQPSITALQIPAVSSTIPDLSPPSISSRKTHKKTNPPNNNNTDRGRPAATTSNKPSPQ